MLVIIISGIHKYYKEIQKISIIIFLKEMLVFYFSYIDLMIFLFSK